MKNCKTCGTQIAKSAKTCPSCGAKNKKPPVALIIFLVIALVLGGLFAIKLWNYKSSDATITANGTEYNWTEYKDLYHEYYLNRIFTKHVGMSMHRYILNLRINEGKRLLLNSNLSISDIASCIGFNSYTHFSSYLKKETGLSPFEYKNNFKNNI